MVPDADRDIQFFAAGMSGPRQNREMMVGRDADEGAVPAQRHQARDRQVGVAGDPVLRDDGAGGDIGPALLFEEARIGSSSASDGSATISSWQGPDDSTRCGSGFSIAASNDA